MNPNWIILLIGLGAGSLPTWWITSSYYQGMISAEHEAQQKLVIEQQKQNRLALLAYAKRITEGNDQHDKDQIAINRLAADARRVSVHPVLPSPKAISVEPPGYYQTQWMLILQNFKMGLERLSKNASN